MLMPLDHDKIPNLRFIDPAYLKFTMDPVMDYGVPYMVGSTGIGYDGSRVEDFEPSWKMFNNEAYAGRMTLLNDMREAIGAALKLLGYSINSTDEAELAQARDVVIGWKRNIAKFESEQYKNGLVSAEFLLVQGYSGDILQAMDENEDVVYAIPREGTSLASDDMVIPVDAREPDLAHAFSGGIVHIGHHRVALDRRHAAQAHVLADSRDRIGQNGFDARMADKSG